MNEAGNGFEHREYAPPPVVTGVRMASDIELMIMVYMGLRSMMILANTLLLLAQARTELLRGNSIRDGQRRAQNSPLDRLDEPQIEKKHFRTFRRCIALVASGVKEIIVEPQESGDDTGTSTKDR